jgi:hypothetical protein
MRQLRCLGKPLDATPDSNFCVCKPRGLVPASVGFPGKRGDPFLDLVMLVTGGSSSHRRKAMNFIDDPNDLLSITGANGFVGTPGRASSLR